MSSKKPDEMIVTEIVMLVRQWVEQLSFENTQPHLNEIDCIGDEISGTWGLPILFQWEKAKNPSATLIYLIMERNDGKRAIIYYPIPPLIFDVFNENHGRVKL